MTGRRCRGDVAALALAALLVVGASCAKGALIPACAKGALPPACEELEGEARGLAMELLESEYPHDCCDDTIACCLGEEPMCRLAWRLAANVCRRVGEGQDAERIRRALSRRARSMMPGGEPAEVDLHGVPPLGAEDAPVEVVVYACARCPFCSKLVPQLHDAIASGPLQGKARMYFRVFPIRNHEFSKEGGLALVAAAGQGRFWEYLLEVYENFDTFCVDRLPVWAEAVGMDRQLFERHVADPATRDALVESKKEGLRNEVDVTPTVFLNRRRFVGDLTYEELADAIGEEADSLRGELYGRP
jgi:predicted DsbA family dithiol-disulfide isomerase